jgi:LuxR family maltose regulon positive regulatory protein
MADEIYPFPILRTKLHRPPLTMDLVPRPELLAWLDRHGNLPFTLVSAPAGYGKTTLVSSWIETLEKPTAWLSLDDQDDDLAVFLTYLIAAIQTKFPHACQDTLALLNARSLPPLAVLVRRFSNDLEALEGNITLILDDYHVLHEMAIHNLLHELFQHPPRRLRLVFITRRDPPLSLVTLRARAQMAEIRQQNLRFTVAETTAFLQQTINTPVTDAVAISLAEKTEGWVTGLRLAALFHRHQGNLEVLLQDLPANISYVSEYLMVEVLSQQPPELQDFLMQTSILDGFCGELCDAVRGEEPAGVCGPEARESKSQTILEHLYTESLFLVPQSHEPQWYRYHHVFRAFLQSQLQRRYSRGEIAALHSRASRWFANHDFIEETIQHALAAGDTPYAIEVIEAHRHDLLNREQWRRLERILRLCDAHSMATQAPLLVLRAWGLRRAHRISEMEDILQRAESLLASPAVEDGIARRLRGEMHAMRSYTCYHESEWHNAFSHARQALDALPPDHAYARGLAVLILSVTYHVLGDRTHAFQLANEATTQVDAPQQARFRAGTLSALCFLYWKEADLPSLRQTATLYLRHAETWHLAQTLHMAHYFLGMEAYQRNDLVTAETHLTFLIQDRYSALAFMSLHMSFALALVYQAQDRPDEAGAVIEDTLAFVLDLDNTALIHHLQAFQAELALRQGRMTEARHWAQHIRPEPFPPMNWFYTPQLTFTRVLLAQATPESQEKAAAFLDRLHAFVVTIHNTRFRIDVLALQALLHDVRGDEPAALVKLTDALALAEPGGFIRVFVDLGPRMADLLTRLLERRVAVGYITKLLSAFTTVKPEAGLSASLRPAAAPCALNPSALDEPLTTREIQVLELLGQRLQDKEIASYLGIAPTTVKTHLRHLYQKLRVNSRFQAVSKAHALGLLSHR